MPTLLDLIDSPEDIIDVNIFDFLGLGSLDQEQKDEMFKKMLETIEERVLTRMAESLTEEERQEAERLMTTNDNDGLQAFTQRHNNDLLLFFAEESLFYKTELITAVNYPEVGEVLVNAAS